MERNTLMSLIQQEQLKTADLKALVYSKSSVHLALFKKVLNSLGVKKVLLPSSVDDVVTQQLAQQVDIVLLDMAQAEGSMASDWVDQLVYGQQLSPKQLLLLCSDDPTHLNIRLEYPYHQVAYVPHPLNHSLIEKQIKQFCIYQPAVKAIQSLALLHRHSDALKLVLFQKQKQTSPDLLLYLERLHAQVLLDTHQLDQVKDLIKPALQQQKEWALWANFRMQYEQESPSYCLELLQRPANSLSKFVERRVSYQLYLLLVLGQPFDAWQLASRIPANQQTPRLLRLIHTIAVVTGHLDDAQSLLEKKRKLFPKGKANLICNLMEMRALLFAAHQQAFAKQPIQCNTTLIQQLLEQTQQDKSAVIFDHELALIDADLLRLQGKSAEALAVLQQLDLDKTHPLMLQIWCHAAVLAALLRQPNLCVRFLWQAHCSAYHMVDCSQRIHGLCMLQQTLHLIPSALRPIQALADLAVEQADVWGAAELMYLCLTPTERQQDLTDLLVPLGFKHFHGIALL